MPLRPPLYPRILRIQPSAKRPLRPRFSQPSFQYPHSHFHTSTILNADSSPPNHYETLSLTSSASPAEIKKQFFTLSKKYHPDKNPGDPNASTRFVQISEAYHVLSVPEKRASYDRDLARWTGGGSAGSGRAGGVPKGSYSSAQGFAGSRPPSGLSRRRTQFRGPPPSFYKSGGYGAQGAKRTEHADQSASGSAEAGADQGSYGEFGGFGPGQTAHGNEVPHFDDARHKQTHDHVNEFIHQKRREREGAQPSKIVDELASSSGTLLNFVLVGGTIAFIAWTLTLFNRGEKKTTPSKKGKEG